ncbi:tetratricopeptide repeat protein [Mailhella massiliensis]|uniref:tetratricopeptide repeat protein n=1 Tax=Mailhella massiliensis TaxID=1903261 RepID=UPI00097CF62F|nr:tetratricopeptide repeat protein [Mailhella massiliensis]
MKNEKTRGVMLTSSAVILGLAAFAAGFVCGNLTAEYKDAGRGVQVPVVASPAVAPAADAAGDEHIRHLREEAMAEPGDAGRWTKLGNACFDAGDAEGAIEAYQASLRLEPGNADVRTDMGSMYRLKGEPLRAVESYEQALRDMPGHKNAVFNKGVTLLLDLEKPEEAVAFWNAVLAENPDFTLSSGEPLKKVMPALAVDAGLQLEAHDRKETALRAYAEALKLDASFAPALVHRAWLLENMGRASEALPLWKRVLELHPDATDPAGRPVRDRIKK